MPKAPRYGKQVRKGTKRYTPYSNPYPVTQAMSVVPTKLLMAQRPEVGSVDVNIGVGTIAADEINTNNGVFLVNPVQTGTGIQNRSRNDIKALSIAVRGHVRAEAQTSPVTGDIYIVYDKSPQTMLPTFQTMFSGISEAGAAINTVNAFTNPNQNRRFIVISHDTFDLPIQGGATDLQTDVCVDMYRKTGLKSTYSANANPLLVASISVGAFYLVVNCRDQASTAAGNNGMFYNLVTRFRFIG